jgi:tRNA(Ile)-lysidine synthase TilS/MesJ
MNKLNDNVCELIINDMPKLPIRDIEKSIIKKYRKSIFSEFVKAINDYEMIQEGDKIAVAISGGKDSLLMAKLFQELQRHKKFNFELVYISMDPGFNTINKENLLENCSYLEIPVEIFESKIFEVVEKIALDYPCYMCAKMRRGALYSKAKELGANKLALGHHFNDVIETTLLNVIYGGSFKTMMPKLKSKNFENIQLIRPMFYVREEAIKRFSHNTGLQFMNCGCVVAASKTSSKRREMKELVSTLKENYSQADKSIFMSAKNVYIDSILGYVDGDKKVSFLDDYDD